MGERIQAIGRGGRTSKIYALTDRDCRPSHFCSSAARLLIDGRLTIRQQVEANGMMPDIPPKANRLAQRCSAATETP